MTYIFQYDIITFVTENLYILMYLGSDILNFFNQYKGLRRELYVLIFGRVVTNMGATIWPMLTLILSNKLGYSAEKIATIILIMNICQLPTAIIGGKLADKFDKRKIIIVCDLVTVTSFIICGIIPISNWFILLFFIGGMFGSMEWPSYDALFADLTLPEDRERAYSLNYMGANLGLVLSPIIGGMLFEHYLGLSFIIEGVATLSSTILIIFFVKNVKREKSNNLSSEYEDEDGKSSIFKVLLQRKIIIYFTICCSISSLVYAQYNFLIPLNLEMLYGAKGALYFGTLTSVNAIVVIICTPLFTRWFSNVTSVNKIIIGELLIGGSFSMFIFFQGKLYIYYISMVIFTMGEVFQSLGKQPYLTRRVPASHRGRVSSFNSIFTNCFTSIAQRGIGTFVDTLPITIVWTIITVISGGAAFMDLILGKFDKKKFPLLYEDKILVDENISTK